VKGLALCLLVALACACRTYDTTYTDDAGGMCVKPHAQCSEGCVDVSSDRDNCGACGFSCGPLALCVSSTCVACPPNETACGTTGAAFCADLTANDQNCGSCGNACALGTSCKAGQCVCPLTTCGTACVDTTNDAMHCGSCTNACPSGAANEIATCTNSQCSILCAAPFADCDGNGTNGCETNLQTSASSCGACGRSCFTGGCSAGLCGATTYATGGTLGPLAVDATSVYWADRSASGAIFSAPIGGGAGTSIVSDNAATVLGVDASQIVWLHLNDEIDSVPVSGGSTTKLDQKSGVRGLAFEGGYVYYTLSSGPVMRAGEDGSSAPVTLTGATNPSAIAVDGANVYFADGAGDLFVVPVSAQNVPPTPFASGAQVSATIALDATHVYWVTGSGNIFRQTKTGATATQLASGQPIVTNLATDGVALYWGDASGIIDRMPVTGGIPVPITKAQPGTLRTVVVDSSRVYWSSDTLVGSTTK
jgi:hypothetical protein